MRALLALFGCCSLLGYIVCASLCPAGAGAFASQEQSAEQRALAEISGIGGSYEKDENGKVTQVKLPAEVGDEFVPHLLALRDLKELSFFGSKRLTDKGVVALKALGKLEHLDLHGT